MERQKSNIPVDHGYAWVIAAALLVIHIFRGCFMRSIGLISLELVEYFSGTKGSSAIFLSIVLGARVLASVLVAYVFKTLSHRLTITFGGFLCTLGLVLTSYFAFNLTSAVWCMGLLTGLGLGLITCVSLSVVTQYFNRYRTLGNSMIYGGVSVGAFIGPYLFEYLVIEHSLRGGLLLFGGIYLNSCVFSMLLRPISYYDNDEDEEEDKANQDQEAKENEEEKLKSISKSPKLDYCRHILSCVLNGLTPEILCNIWFWVYAIIYALYIQTNPMSFLIIVTHGSDIGLTKVQTSLLLTIQGGVDLFSRFGMAIIADLPWVNRSILSTSLLLLSGFLWIFSGFSNDFFTLLAFAILQPIVGGSNNSILSSVLPDIVSKKHITVAYAYTFFVQGVLFNTMPRLCGLLRDHTGTWRSTFWFLGCISILACVLGVLLSMHIQRKKAKENENAPANV